MTPRRRPSNAPDIIEKGGKQPPNPPIPPEGTDRVPAPPIGSGEPVEGVTIHHPDRPRDLQALNVILNQLGPLSAAEEKRVFAYLKAYAEEHGY